MPGVVKRSSKVISEPPNLFEAFKDEDNCMVSRMISRKLNARNIMIKILVVSFLKYCTYVVEYYVEQKDNGKGFRGIENSHASFAPNEDTTTGKGQLLQGHPLSCLAGCPSY